jgi:hypothetical protein
MEKNKNLEEYMGDLIIYVVLEKYHRSKFSLCQNLKFRASSIQLKPVLDVSWRGLSLSSCPRHSLRVLDLIPLAPKSHVALSNYELNCEQDFSFFILLSD